MASCLAVVANFLRLTVHAPRKQSCQESNVLLKIRITTTKPCQHLYLSSPTQQSYEFSFFTDYYSVLFLMWDKETHWSTKVNVLILVSYLNSLVRVFF